MLVFYSKSIKKMQVWIVLHKNGPCVVPFMALFFLDKKRPVFTGRLKKSKIKEALINASACI